MAKNGQKCLTRKNVKKLSKKQSKMLKTVKNCQKQSKNSQKCRKTVKNVRKRQQCGKTVIIPLKVSKNRQK